MSGFAEEAVNLYYQIAEYYSKWWNEKEATPRIQEDEDFWNQT